jgi:hypothetical protein
MLAAMMAAFTTVAANAAEMKVEKPKKGQYDTMVFVEGEIVKGDHNKFVNLTKNLPDGRILVALNSMGGALEEGLNIGLIIRAKRMGTFAFDCASACALMWLAGSPRGAFENSKVGFHAAYRTDGKITIEDGTGNAYVGAYLAKLGFSYNAIAYMTQAAPEGMEWLDATKAKKHNIAYTVLKSPKPAQSVAATEPWCSTCAVGGRNLP